MQETELISSLLPSHPDILPILQNIRDKYKIPEISPEDDGITEILLADGQIDWDAVRQEIELKCTIVPCAFILNGAGTSPKSFGFRGGGSRGFGLS